MPADDPSRQGVESQREAPELYTFVKTKYNMEQQRVIAPALESVGRLYKTYQEEPFCKLTSVNKSHATDSMYGSTWQSGVTMVTHVCDPTRLLPLPLAIVNWKNVSRTGFNIVLDCGKPASQCDRL